MAQAVKIVCEVTRTYLLAQMAQFIFKTVMLTEQSWEIFVVCCFHDFGKCAAAQVQAG